MDRWLIARMWSHVFPDPRPEPGIEARVIDRRGEGSGGNGGGPCPARC